MGEGSPTSKGVSSCSGPGDISISTSVSLAHPLVYPGKYQTRLQIDVSGLPSASLVILIYAVASRRDVGMQGAMNFQLP